MAHNAGDADAGTDEPVLEFTTQAEWEEWLSEKHDGSSGVWLRIARRGSGHVSPTYAEALDVALCWGWIDARKRALDETAWLQRFTPRTPRSRWSQVNTRHAERLVADGRMQPSGLREMERAKADGRWTAAYASPRTATVPDDLAAALDAVPEAAAFFAGLDGRNRYAVLYRIESAKRPETREKRIRTLVAMLADGQKLYP